MSKIHGLNGLVYFNYLELPSANSWSITFDVDLAEVPDFGDVWMDQVKGILTWSGSIEAWYDNTEDRLWNAATAASASGAKALVVYPNRTDLTRYWYGNAFASWSIDVSTGDAVSISADITGDGILTKIPLNG